MKRRKLKSRSSTTFRKPNRPCPICASGIKHVDYKDVELLVKFLTPGGALLPKRITGVTNKNQRKIAQAVKQARVACLLPFRVL